MTAQVDVIIPTFNQSEMTVACARSLAMHTAPGVLRILWVDNGSAPAEVAATEDGFEEAGLDVVALRLPENLGFVKATNVGLAVSTAPAVLLLNNDTEVPPGWLPPLQKVLAERPKVGLVGPRSSSKAQWQGKAAPAPGYTVLRANQMLAFFCTLIRREVLVECGYLSEEYRAGLGDDDDYCARASKAGWQLALRTDVEVVHHHRTTFKAVYGAEYQAMQQENLAHFKRKWKR